MGDIALTYYIIKSGEVLCVDGKLEVLTSLGPGNAFGEQALISEEEGKRACHVIAESEIVEVLVIHKTNLMNVLEGEDIQKIVFNSYLNLAIDKSMYLKDFSHDTIDFLKKKIKLKFYQNKEVILSQNSTLKSLYICVDGELKFYGENGDVVTFQKGSIFGESYLIPRARLDTPVKGVLKMGKSGAVYVLSIRDLELLLGSSVEEYFKSTGKSNLYITQNVLGSIKKSFFSIDISEFRITAKYRESVLGYEYIGSRADNDSNQIYIMKIIDFDELDEKNAFRLINVIQHILFLIRMKFLL